jgi:hypothetical protein
VKVAADLLRHIGNGIERVHRAGLSGAGDTDNRHCPDVALLKIAQCLAQQVDAHPPVFIDAYRHQILAANAEDIRRLAQRIMAALRHDDRQPGVTVVPQRRYQPCLVDAREAVARAQRVVAAGPERGEIGRGAARAERPRECSALCSHCA